LARHFLAKYARATSKIVNDFDADALRRLEAYRWPGNVRELENAVERAVVVTRSNRISIRDLPELESNEPESTDQSMEALEKRHMGQVLQQTGGNVTRAAEILGINRVTLYNKIKKYGLR
jgi:two-component system response regulator HydG